MGVARVAGNKSGGKKPQAKGLALQTGREPLASPRALPHQPSLERAARLECVYLWPSPISCFSEKGLREGC